MRYSSSARLAPFKSYEQNHVIHILQLSIKIDNGIKWPLVDNEPLDTQENFSDRAIGCQDNFSKRILPGAQRVKSCDPNSEILEIQFDGRVVYGMIGPSCSGKAMVTLKFFSDRAIGYEVDCSKGILAGAQRVTSCDPNSEIPEPTRTKSGLWNISINQDPTSSSRVRHQPVTLVW